MKTFKEFFEDFSHYPAMIDPKKDKSKDAWIKGDPTEPIDVSDNSGDMKSVLDKANRDVEKERGAKLKPFNEQAPEKKKKKESGDTWETKPGIWGGKNPDGEIEYYSGEHAKEMSRAWAKGQTKKRGNASDSKKPDNKSKTKQPDSFELKSYEKDSGKVEKLEMKDGNHLIVSAAAKKHISTHNEIGIGSVFSKDIDIDKVLAKVLPKLDVKDIKNGVYSTKSPGIGYNLVLSMDKAKKLSGAKMTSVEKEERDGPIKVPAIKTTAPLSDFKTDILTLIIRPTNPDRLHPSLEKDKDTHNAIKAGKSFTLLASFPGDPNIPRASEWGDKYAVILPPKEKGGKEPKRQQTTAEPMKRQTAAEPEPKKDKVDITPTMEKNMKRYIDWMKK
jgi:hypothetical protein